MNSTSDNPLVTIISEYTSLIGFAISCLGGLSFAFFRIYKCYFKYKASKQDIEIADFIENINSNVSPI